MPAGPSYSGRGLVNLIAELEARLTGRSAFDGLTPDLSGLIPEADSYVLVVFDGLGVAQLEHPSADSFSRKSAGVLEAPFPTTTSVSLATVATGLPPSQHGQVAHLTWMEELGVVVNTLKWVTLTGGPVRYDYGSLLPQPNLWERLRPAGVEPITVQPGDFTGSPLTDVLYRGVRFEPAWGEGDLVDATVQVASVPRRLVFTYVPHVDFAGHVFGLGSEEFTEALKIAVGVWEGLVAGLPSGVTLIGTSDHGLKEFTEEDKILVREERFEALRFAGDPRGVHLWGDQGLMEDLAGLTEGSLVDPVALIGPEPTPTALSRLGEKLLLAPEDKAVLPKGFDKRLRCYHGGLSAAEVEIPLLLR